ncbi:hypothetical protein [Sphaerisporangium aureirubrum]|uniref:Uncharacterized protein n=1 Tax=Sphaerisporangium aureirubrum TaxID=1544736 RepID=A0ABW1NQC9_9ACTN
MPAIDSPTGRDRAGFIWSTRRNLSEQSVVLFGDRAPGLKPADLPAVELGTDAGLTQVNEWLRPFRASVEPPGSDPGW